MIKRVALAEYYHMKRENNIVISRCRYPLAIIQSFYWVGHFQRTGMFHDSGRSRKTTREKRSGIIETGKK